MELSIAQVCGKPPLVKARAKSFSPRALHADCGCTCGGIIGVNLKLNICMRRDAECNGVELSDQFQDALALGATKRAQLAGDRGSGRSLS